MVINPYPQDVIERYDYCRSVFGMKPLESAIYYDLHLSLYNIRYVLESFKLIPKPLMGFMQDGLVRNLKKAEELKLRREINEKELMDKCAANFSELVSMTKR